MQFTTECVNEKLGNAIRKRRKTSFTEIKLISKTTYFLLQRKLREKILADKIKNAFISLFTTPIQKTINWSSIILTTFSIHIF
jgi:hypothetical protein